MSTTYSTIADVLNVYPQASGFISQVSNDPVAYIDEVRVQQKGHINSLIKDLSKPDNFTQPGLALVEANFTVAQIVRGIKSGTDIEVAAAFDKVAKDLLKHIEWTTSYTTPATVAGFAGNGTLNVTIFDQFTPTAEWEIRYQGSNDWTVWNTAEGELGTYNTSNDSTFPDAATDSTDSELAVKSIVLAITPGAVAFAKNDTWRFNTYSAKVAKSLLRTHRTSRG